MNDDPIDLTLLPASAQVGPEGSLSVGGVDLAGLAAEFGTPLYVYDEGELRDRCREYRRCFGPGIAYASKAFLCTAMAKLVAEEGLDLDVATGGELHVALHAGFPAERIVLHGNNKSSGELAPRSTRAWVASSWTRSTSSTGSTTSLLEPAHRSRHSYE